MAAQFEGLITPCLAQATDFAFSRTHNLSDAEDVVQEARIRAWIAFHSYDPARAFGGWFRRIVERAAIDHHRRQVGYTKKGGGNREVFSYDPDFLTQIIDEDPINAVPDGFIPVAIRCALDELSDMEYEVVIAIYVRKEKAVDVADRLSISRAQVDNCIDAGRRALQDFAPVGLSEDSCAALSSDPESERAA